MKTFTLNHVCHQPLGILSGFYSCCVRNAHRAAARTLTKSFGNHSGDKRDGFFFPFHASRPPLCRIISVGWLAVAIFARYARHSRRVAQNVCAQRGGWLCI